jgi:hypothetical protein
MKTAETHPDRVFQIMQYEAGEMDRDEMVAFFQSLVDDGTVWQLQGHYGRTAAALIEAGYVHRRMTH